jgi:hypothetical protein
MHGILTAKQVPGEDAKLGDNMCEGALNPRTREGSHLESISIQYLPLVTRRWVCIEKAKQHIG